MKLTGCGVHPSLRRLHHVHVIECTARSESMTTIANILYPVDFSPSCVAMAAYVKRAAALLGARVSLIHVVDPSGYNGMQLYIRPMPEVLEEYMGISREKLDSFLAADFPAAQCPRILTSGDA